MPVFGVSLQQTLPDKRSPASHPNRSIRRWILSSIRFGPIHLHSADLEFDFDYLVPILIDPSPVWSKTAVLSCFPSRNSPLICVTRKTLSQQLIGMFTFNKLTISAWYWATGFCLFFVSFRERHYLSHRAKKKPSWGNRKTPRGVTFLLCLRHALESPFCPTHQQITDSRFSVYR